MTDIKQIYLFWLHLKFPIVIILVLISGGLWFLKKRSQRFKNKMAAPKKSLQKPATLITSHDIKAIAGEDELMTQLDLARAYMELGKKKIAKQILEYVLHHGTPLQRKAAHELMLNL